MAHIVVGTDLTEASRPAFDAAVALAKDTDLPMTLVHALHITPYVTLAGGTERDVQSAREGHSMDRALELSTAWVEEARKAGIHATGRVDQEEPAPLILRVAKEMEAAFIVVGTQGRSGLARFILGSTAETVVRKSTVPVLVVPTHH